MSGPERPGGVSTGAVLDLDQMIGRAIRQYQIFTDIPPPEDADAFAAHCRACKAAVAHLEQLFRLGRSLASNANPRGVAQKRGDELDRLIHEARASLPAPDD